MEQNPTDPASVAAQVKGTTIQNVSLWLLVVLGALIVAGLGSVARFLGIAGLWLFILIAAAMLLSAAFSLVMGMALLFMPTSRSRRETALLWQARIVKVAESLGFALVTWVLYRHFY